MFGTACTVLFLSLSRVSTWEWSSAAPQVPPLRGVLLITRHVVRIWTGIESTTRTSTDYPLPFWLKHALLLHVHLAVPCTVPTVLAEGRKLHGTSLNGVHAERVKEKDPYLEQVRE